MRRMDSMEMMSCTSDAYERRDAGRGAGRGVLAAVALLMGMVWLAAVPAAATPATFNSVFGFNAEGLEGLPVGVLTAQDSFLAAGEAGAAGLDVELMGSTNLCIFTASSPVCQADTAGIGGPYSAFVTITVSAVNTPSITGPFTLFLSGLVSGPYAANEVTVELDPTVPAGLDTSGIPGFDLRPFGRIADETFGTPAAYNYIGWRVQVGDTISFRFDVSTAPGTRGTPQLMANAISRAILPIPEPGTALLMGLGLAGLSMAQRRLAPTND